MLTVFCKYRSLEIVRPAVWLAVAAVVVSRCAGRFSTGEDTLRDTIAFVLTSGLLIAIFALILSRERLLLLAVTAVIALQTVRLLPLMQARPAYLEAEILRERPVFGLPAETAAGVRKLFIDRRGRRYLVSLPTELRYVTEFRYTGEVPVPEGPRNPGGFDAAAFTRRYGACARLSVRAGRVDPSDILAVDTFFMPAVDAARDRLSHKWEERYGEADAAMFHALALGDKRGLSAEADARLQGSGLAHLAAVSGTHLGLLLLPISALTKRPRSRNRGLEYLILPLLVVYLALCRFGVGITRSLLGFYIRVGARARGQPVDTFHVTALSALAVLLLDPISANRIDFLLSFSAATALAYTFDADRRARRLHDHYNPRFGVSPSLVERLTRRGEGLARQVIKGLQIQLLLAVPLMRLSNQLNILSVFATIPAVMITGGLLAGLIAAPLLGGSGVRIQKILLQAFLGLNRAVSDFGPLKLMNRPGDWLLIAAVALLLALYKQRYYLASLMPGSGNWRRGLATALAGVILVTRLLAPHIGAAVWFFDVGHGDAVLIVSETGATCLIDGGDKDHGYRTLRPALRALGIARIDCAVVTHAHSDHYAGVAELARLGLVDTVLLSDVMADAPVRHGKEEDERGSETNFNDIGKDRSWREYFSQYAAVRAISRGDTVTLPGLDTPLEILHPPPAMSVTDLNDTSVIIRFTHRDTTFLLTGDATKAVLSCTEIWEERSKYAILKVAHHGSAGSLTPDGIRSFRPCLGVISCPARSRHHPAPEVVNLLLETGRVLRTDRDAAIRVGWDDTVRIGSMR